MQIPLGWAPSAKTELLLFAEARQVAASSIIIICVAELYSCCQIRVRLIQCLRYSFGETDAGGWIRVMKKQYTHSTFYSLFQPPFSCRNS